MTSAPAGGEAYKPLLPTQPLSFSYCPPGPFWR